MAFGARQEQGVWRICERKGRTIKHISQRRWPDIEVKFSGRAAAEKCAHTLNEAYWDRYAKKRQKTDDPEVAWGITQVILEHGGITMDEFERIKG